MIPNEREDDTGFWRDETHKYTEVYEEITRQKKENEHIEAALFQVVTHKNTHIQFSNNETITRKQIVKKLFGAFKIKKPE